MQVLAGGLLVSVWRGRRVAELVLLFFESIRRKAESGDSKFGAEVSPSSSPRPGTEAQLQALLRRKVTVPEFTLRQSHQTSTIHTLHTSVKMPGFWPKKYPGKMGAPSSSS